jgi:hypothetical protein
MKYYSLQKDFPDRQGRGGAEVDDRNEIQNEGEAGGSAETGTVSAASLPEDSWRSADDATAATECEAQISTYASNLVEGHDVGRVTDSEAGSASNEEFTQPVKEEEKKYPQEHEQPIGVVADEMNTERGTERSGMDKDNLIEEQSEGYEEDGEKQAEFEEEEQEIKEEQEKKKENAENIKPTSSETSRATTAIVVSGAQSRENLLVIGTRTTGASTPSEPASPPLSRIGFQSLLSDSDSPEVLDGSPSPLADTETSVDSDTPAPVAAEQLPASASDGVHPGLDCTSTVLEARAETTTVAEPHSNVVPDRSSAIASSSARRQGSNAHEGSLKPQKMVPQQAGRGQSNRCVQQEARRMRDDSEDDHIEAVAAATEALMASVVARDVSGREVIKKAETGAIRSTEVRTCLQCLLCLLLSKQRSVVDAAPLFCNYKVVYCPRLCPQREAKRERGADCSSDQNQAFARRQLARRERKKPAACVIAVAICLVCREAIVTRAARFRLGDQIDLICGIDVRVAGEPSRWWDAQTHEPVLKRAKVSHHSTRGSPPLGSQARRGSGMKVRLPEADNDDTQQVVIER